MLSQKRAVKELDIYGKAASKFLSLTPRCCRPENLPPPDHEEEHATWSKGERPGGPSLAARGGGGRQRAAIALPLSPRSGRGGEEPPVNKGQGGGRGWEGALLVVSGEFCSQE